MSKFCTTKPGKYPTDEETAEHRKKKHIGHAEYFYGNYWCCFMDDSGKCFLEFDVGHFASEFITRKISREDYEALKQDESLFNDISGKIG